MRSAFFRGVMQLRLVVSCRRFGTTCRFLHCLTPQKSADLVGMVFQLPDDGLSFQIVSKSSLTSHPSMDTALSPQHLPHTNHKSDQKFPPLLSTLVSSRLVSSRLVSLSSCPFQDLQSRLVCLELPPPISPFVVLIDQSKPALQFSIPPVWRHVILT